MHLYTEEERQEYREFVSELSESERRHGRDLCKAKIVDADSSIQNARAIIASSNPARLKRRAEARQSGENIRRANLEFLFNLYEESLVRTAGGSANAGISAKVKARKLLPKKSDHSHWLDQAGLTERQRECYEMLFERGMKKKHIAEYLQINRKTLDEHLAQASKKINLTVVHDKTKRRRAVNLLDA